MPKDPSPSDEPEDEGAAVVAGAVVVAGAAVVAVTAEELLELSSPSDPQAPAIKPKANSRAEARLNDFIIPPNNY
ncbi:MAG: hypothetical protein QGI12_05770 [Acidimicrobiales bacterium]|nr:hypothetical protein [Acidimicrobiales bacterium]